MNNNRFIPSGLKAFLGLGLVVILAVALAVFTNLKTAKTETLSPTVKRALGSQQNTPPPVILSPSQPFTPQLYQVDSTSDWKLYKYSQRNEYMYEVKYPPDWRPNNIPDSPGNWGYTVYQSGGKSYVYSRVTLLRPGGWTLEDVIQNEKNYLTNAKEENLVIQGFNAKRITGVLSKEAHPNIVGYYEEAIYIRVADKIYQIALVQNPEEDYLETFNGMLSTFNLVE